MQNASRKLMRTPCRGLFPFHLRGVVWVHMETTAPAPVASKPNHPKFVRWAVVLGIIVVLNIFFVVVRSLVLPAPQFDDYCPAAAHSTYAADAPSCDAQGGIWTETGPVGSDKTNPNAPAGYCDFYAKCQPVYDAAMAKYDMYAFSLMVVLGLISIVAGIILTGSSIVSSGLSYGGVLSLIIGSAMYWNEAGNWLRLVISAIALVALLYIGWKRFRD